MQSENRILNIEQLATELAITPADALGLMKREDFPATHLGGENYVVDRSHLTLWVRHHARNAQCLKDRDIMVADEILGL